MLEKNGYLVPEEGMKNRNGKEEAKACQKSSIWCCVQVGQRVTNKGLHNCFLGLACNLGISAVGSRNKHALTA